MPIYEYACTHCHKTFEEWLKNDDAASEHPCPDCGAMAPRQISNTTFILKGGGWYVTEYGNHKDDGSSDSASLTPDGANASPEAAGAVAPATDTAAPATTSATASADTAVPPAAAKSAASVDPPPAKSASSEPAAGAGL